MIKRVGLACFLLLMDLLYFFNKYPDWINRYAGHINIGNDNLDLLTKEIFDYRALLFVFLVLLPSLLLAWIITEISCYYQGREGVMERLEKRKSWPLVLLYVLFFIMFLASAAQAENLSIKYAYDGKYGKYGIADTATAYYTGQGKDIKIGTARALKIIKMNPGPNHLRVEETHYYADGPIMYQGLLEFKFALGGAILVKEERISGKKRNTLFTSWPSGN